MGVNHLFKREKLCRKINAFLNSKISLCYHAQNFSRWPLSGDSDPLNKQVIISFYGSIGLFWKFIWIGVPCWNHTRLIQIVDYVKRIIFIYICICAYLRTDFRRTFLSKLPPSSLSLSTEIVNSRNLAFQCPVLIKHKGSTEIMSMCVNSLSNACDVSPVIL